MKNNYIPTFGVEIHVELLTKTKAFSSSVVSYGEKPNTNINNFDMGYPGTKPTVNKQMVKYAYWLAKALKMEIAEKLFFDRKHYFYEDLPKGYQITQFYNPIGKNGKFEIFDENRNSKLITITQIHMEEDTGKQIIKNGNKYFDFNRAGIPLIEIVSGHNEFETITDVLDYVKQIRKQLIFLGITNGKMSEGSMRVDVNVSVRKNKKDRLGTRVEIKNINSFANIRAAVEYEIEDQISILENNDKIHFCTKRYDESKSKTELMRSKKIILQYNYFPEGNINPIRIDDKLKKEFEEKKILILSDLKKDLLKLIPEKQVDILLSSSSLFNLFLKLKNNKNESNLVNLITNNLLSIVNKNKINLGKLSINENDFKKILDIFIEKKTTSTIINELLNSLVKGENISNTILDISSVKQMDNNELKKLMNEIIKSVPTVLEDFKTKPDKVFRFIVGQIMKETKGKANPKQVSEVFELVFK